MKTATKETAEMMHFLCLLAKRVQASLSDDGRISVPEGIAMLSMAKSGATGFAGMDKIPGELSDLAPDEARELVEIPATYFHPMLPHQQRVISEAALACLPSLVNLFQTVRISAALAAEVPGDAPRALPA